MKLSDGLFLESTRVVARDYSEIAYEERIVDAACMQLVMNPSPDIAGKGIANPSALLLSAVLMLRVLAAGDTRTPDLGGTATTTKFAGTICQTLETADELGAVHV